MIRVENLSLRAGEFSLKRISLEIASEEYFVLLGPTGSGKSLFIKKKNKRRKESNGIRKKLIKN